jgi:hypothetical protein
MTTTPTPLPGTDDFPGGAVYLEFFKPLTPSIIHPNRSAVTQILFVPETKPTATSHGTPFCAYRRRISSDYPRRNWKMVAGGTRSERLLAERSGTPDAMTEVAALMNSAMTGYIDTLARSDWELRVKPIIVEITGEDIEAVRLGKTPYKAIGKVLRVRKAVGLPNNVLDAPVSPF